MLTVRCDTARFKGAGRIDCFDCGRTTHFPADCQVVMLRVAGETVVRDAETGVVLHDCREFVLEESRWKGPGHHRYPPPVF